MNILLRTPVGADLSRPSPIYRPLVGVPVVRPLNGTPNSYVLTTGGRALVYDNQGRLLYDIDANRVKMVIWDQAPDGNYYNRDVKLKGPVPPQWLSLLP
jgi:hypothetical protein